MINKAILVGRVGTKPEIKEFNGSKNASFSLATNKRWTGKELKAQEKTTWHNIVVWNKLADLVGTYVNSGMLLYLEGEILNEMYEKDGVKKYISKINASVVKFLSRDTEKVQGTKEADAPAGNMMMEDHTPKVDAAYTSDDIPF